MSFVVTFDCEFTGPNPFEHHMPDLGVTFYRIRDMCKIDPYTGRPAGKGDGHFSTLINMPKESKWDPETVSDFWETKVSPEHYKHLKQTVESGRGKDMSDVMSSLIAYLQKCWEFSKGDMVLGSNRVDQGINYPIEPLIYSDAFWLSFHLTKNGHPPITKIFGRDMRLIDFNSYHQGCSFTPHNMIKEFEKAGKGFDPAEAAFRIYGVCTRPSIPKTHKAFEDASNIAQAHCLILSSMHPYFVQTHCSAPDDTHSYRVAWSTFQVNKTQ